MKTFTCLLRLAAILAGLAPAGAKALFINELHYDNAGVDVGEGVEIAGAAGSDLDGYALVFYNGSNGTAYGGVALSGVLGNQNGGFGTAFFDAKGLQNGAPDGVALVDPAGLIVQFLSYEGAFIATDGAAAGLLSTDIGIVEDGTGPAGTSLQLVGTGSAYGDFAWIMADASYGAVNVGQSFVPVPLPAALPLMLLATATLGGLARSGPARGPAV